MSAFSFSPELYFWESFIWLSGKRSLVNSNFSNMSEAVLFLPPGDKNETQLSHVSF